MLVDNTITDYLDKAAAGTAVPGGGSVAALSGAMGAALLSMVCNLTLGKKRYADVQHDIAALVEKTEALRLLEGLIAMVHVKDLVYKEGATGGFTSSKVVTVDESERRVSSRIPGEGIIPWPEILPALAARGFDGWLSLEYERRWYPHDLPPAGEGMRRGFEYLQKLLGRA